MPIRKCNICKNDFYVKPFSIRNGWGILCSRSCKHEDSRKKRNTLNCFMCGQLIYKTPSQLKHSKSGKFFCSKSCQTKWRNAEYSGYRHLGWKGGQTIYRKIMIKAGILIECKICGKNDQRVLAVHHIDKDRSNSNPGNLAWLCHNCHYLVHHDKLEMQKFLNNIRL